VGNWGWMVCMGRWTWRAEAALVTHRPRRDRPRAEYCAEWRSTATTPRCRHIHGRYHRVSGNGGLSAFLSTSVSRLTRLAIDRDRTDLGPDRGALESSSALFRFQREEGREVG
jgi:hypothetical protein